MHRESRRSPLIEDDRLTVGIHRGAVEHPVQFRVGGVYIRCTERVERQIWILIFLETPGVSNLYSVCGSIVKPSCSKCRSKPSATEIPRSRIRTNETQSVSE